MMISGSFVQMAGSYELEIADETIIRQRFIPYESDSQTEDVTNGKKHRSGRNVGNMYENGLQPSQKSNAGRNPGISLNSNSLKDRVTISTEAFLKAAEAFKQDTVSRMTPEMTMTPEDTEMMTLIRILEAITGKKFNVQPMQQNFEQMTSGSQSTLSLQFSSSEIEMSNAAADFSQQIESIQSPVLETVTKSMHYEYEAMSFSSAGKVITADGKEISFSLDMQMTREFYAAYEERVQTLAVDPLVINFGSGGAELSEQTFEFDLNADGQKEEISFVKPETGGFLALDKNSDGIINDGSELFGPNSGNGFVELKQYDLDGNGWIDEADTIYHDLSIWTRDKEGDFHLTALADTNIGAIYVNAADTQFSIKTTTNENLGQIRQSSIYLNEDGSAGTIQQVDLAVEDTQAEITG